MLRRIAIGMDTTAILCKHIPVCTNEHRTERLVTMFHSFTCELNAAALVLEIVGKTAPLDGFAALKEAEALMAAAREGAGDDMDIMVDLHGRTSAALAIQYARVLEPYRPFFIEEPCQPEDWQGTARVAKSTTVPIAAGERLVHRHEFLPLLQSGAIAVAQPDVCHAGGLTEVRRISALCDTFGVAMAPHNPLGPIATMVNIHLALQRPTSSSRR